MYIVICLLGYLVAALFAIFAYGLLGKDPAYPEEWIDLIFWGIMLGASLPCAIQFLREESAELYHWARHLRRHLHTPGAPDGKRISKLDHNGNDSGSSARNRHRSGT